MKANTSPSRTTDAASAVNAVGRWHSPDPGLARRDLASNHLPGKAAEPLVLPTQVATLLAKVPYRKLRPPATSRRHGGAVGQHDLLLPDLVKPARGYGRLRPA